ncbi:MAG: hypothetical protein JO314_07660 [Acidobacteria bacterium]|nr:hypothetical protein [Acidobacteriota bacterium]
MATLDNATGGPAERDPLKSTLSKVPQVTLYFWIIKVLCTTVGETASDFLNVNLGWGLNRTSIVAGVLLAIALFFQFRARKYVPPVYWLAVVLISVFGTLVTDILTDQVGFPLEASTVIFTCALAATFGVWYAFEGTLSIHSIFTRRREALYWLAILFTFALGTAAGDLMAEKLGLGYLVTGLIVVGIIVADSIAFKLGLDNVLAFWVAYILTRPLGASLGDYLSQSRENGGVGLGATVTSVVFLSAILLVVIYLALTRRDAIDIPQAEVASGGRGKGVIYQLAGVVLVVLIFGIGGYYVRKGQLQKQAAASVTPNAPLGDVSNFRKIAADMLAKIRAGDLAGAKTRADDLETAWDNSQAVLQPMNPGKWTEMDTAIDSVLKNVRASDPTASAASLQALIDVIDNLGKGPQTSGPSVSPANTQSRASIGDLSTFRKIAADMLQLSTKGDAAGTKAKATELEKAWDTAQPKLQAANPSKWTELDTAIDDVLKKARTGNAVGPDTQSSISKLISLIDASK